MISCPKCQSALPDWAQSCQFCGTDTGKVARPVVEQKKSNYAYGTAAWVWWAYYAIAGWFVLSGLINLARGIIGFIQFNRDTADNPYVQSFGVFFYFGMAISAAAIVVGMGLILKSDFIRGIANYYCAFMLLFGALDVLSYIGISAIIGPVAYVWMARSALDVVCGGMMIYLILETNDSYFG